jgi:hypothetical protein
MRRSICTTDPHYAVAGERRTWRFLYTTANNLPKNSKLTFEVQSTTKPIDWEIPQTDLKKKQNLIWLQLPNQKIVGANKIQDLKTLFTNYEFTLPVDVKPGEAITICIGALDDNEKNANQCQSYTQRKKIFNLYVNVKDKIESEAFHLDIKGNKLKTLKVIGPSIVSRNKRFDVVVRFEDEFGNLTNNAEENTLIELSYENLRENLNWKLFIPETGFIALPNLYFNEAGIYKIQLKNLKTNETFFSPPIKCFEEYDFNLFWGYLHSENTKYDATKNIENSLRFFRDDKAMQFFATSPFDADDEISNDQWKQVSTHVAEFNEDERFSVFLGHQWLGNLKEEGLRQFIFSKDNKNILRRKDLKTNSLKKIYKTYSSKEMISIPSFTMGSETVFDFKDFNEEFERVVEIYNAWGSSENLSTEGNLRPISGPVKENAEGSIQRALLAGCRFGFIAGGLDDRCIYSSLYDTNQVQYSAGLTAIIAKDHTRDSLMDALYKRSCYATTGEKILTGLNIAGEPIGSEISTSKKPGLLYNRYITGYVIGTTKIKEIVILRNNKIIQTFNPNATSFDFAFDDQELLTNFCIKPKEEKLPFVFYYLRAVQEDSHIVWTSPIWIDLAENSIVSKKMKKK